MVFSNAFRIATSLLLLAGTSLSSITVADRPWLDVTLPTEERLSLLMLQWNKSEIYRQVQGDTVVSSSYLRAPDYYLMKSSSKIMGPACQLVLVISAVILL
jgi:hypothetical protein